MFANTLKTLRQKGKFSQKALGDIFNVSQQTIAKWESDTSTPDPNMLVKIANFFGVSVDFLVGNSIVSSKKVQNVLTTKERELLTAFNRVDSANQSKMLMTLKTAFPEAFNNYPEGFIYPTGFVDIESAKNYYEKTASYTAAFEGTDLVDEEYIELANNLVRSEFNIK